jgi:hypothetical protein
LPIALLPLIIAKNPRYIFFPIFDVFRLAIKEIMFAIRGSSIIQKYKLIAKKIGEHASLACASLAY